MGKSDGYLEKKNKLITKDQRKNFTVYQLRNMTASSDIRRKIVVDLSRILY